MDPQTPKAKLAATHMEHAFKLLNEEAKTKGSRLLSMSISYVEIALMLLNKDRTQKGELTPYSTHVDAENLTDLPK